MGGANQNWSVHEDIVMKKAVRKTKPRPFKKRAFESVDDSKPNNGRIHGWAILWSDCP